MGSQHPSLHVRRQLHQQHHRTASVRETRPSLCLPSRLPSSPPRRVPASGGSPLQLWHSRRQWPLPRPQPGPRSSRQEKTMPVWRWSAPIVPRVRKKEAKVAGRGATAAAAAVRRRWLPRRRSAGASMHYMMRCWRRCRPPSNHSSRHPRRWRPQWRLQRLRRSLPRSMLRVDPKADRAPHPLPPLWACPSRREPPSRAPQPRPQPRRDTFASRSRRRRRGLHRRHARSHRVLLWPRCSAHPPP